MPHTSRTAENSPKSLVIGITGASGAIVARRMFQMLEADERVGRIHLVISGSGLKVLREELGLDVSKSSEVARNCSASARARRFICWIRILAPRLPAVLITPTAWW